MRTNKNQWRQLWINIHLYFGLGFGLIFVLLGLTGSFNVFHREIDQLLNPELDIQETNSEYQSIDKIYKVLQAKYKFDNEDINNNSSWKMYLPSDSTPFIYAVLKNHANHNLSGSLWVAVNPYTAEIMHSWTWGETFVTWVYNLHDNLLLGPFGHKLVGILGLLLLTSVITGVYLWWPRGKSLKYAFIIKRKTNKQRMLLDIHRFFGVYISIFIMVIAFTGFTMTYEEVISNIIKTKENTVNLDKKNVTPSTLSERTINVDVAIGLASNVYPDAELRLITLPAGPDGIYKVIFRQKSEIFTRTFPKSEVWVNPVNGKIVNIINPNQFGMIDTLFSLDFVFHNGDAGGLPGRIIVFISGLVPLILFITGLIMWTNKRTIRRISR